MNICELFLSVEGEGKRTGLPAVFIRKTQCNLRCFYCDSSYSFKEDPERDMTVGSIMNQVYLTSGGLTKGCKAVTLTGGEPLYCKSELDRMQTRDLIDTLTYNRFEVNVETNGSIDLNPWKDVVRQNGFFTMDWKSVSSGFSKSMIPSNLQILDENDVLKFVVGTVKDLDQMKDVLSSNDIRAQVYVSPIFGKIDPKDIVAYVLENRLFNVKVQIQMHKVIWSPDEKGV